MKLKKQVLVITNYRPDQQQSMLRFGNLLTSNKNNLENLEIEETYPTPVFRKICPIGKLRKWAAYLDKYLLFPKRLKRELKSRKDPLHLIHIIDHSNATYLPKLSRITQAKKIITCHDLIAIRTAKGEFAQAQKTSKSGKRLQKWISNSLHYPDSYACDSRQTQEDLNWLIPMSKGKSSVLHLGTELYSSTISEKKDLSKILPFDPLTTNFLLHVGSAAWYKNRKAVFRSFIHSHTYLPDQNQKLVLVGPEPQKEELDDQLKNWIKSNPSAIHSLQNLPENTLDTLYKYAKALVFPSFIEGFGWPPLEAAVRGCPVITTRTGAIEDLLGNYAKYVEPENQQSIDQGVLQTLQVASSTQRAIALPSHEDCRKQYFDLYDQMMAS
ncbi:glycosyltransferase [Opitutales bacterium]|nr:glycosyltransferase [Opitutales bacterium]